MRDWLKALPKEERQQIGTDILTVQYAWPVGKPLVDSLGSGLWKVRTRLPYHQARVIFLVHKEIIVLLHGFLKKEKTTPKADLDLAKTRQAEFLKSESK